MRTLYLECRMGAAGDMLTAALLELIPDREGFIRQMNALNLPGVRIAAEPAETCGIAGTRMRVTVNGEEEESCDVRDQHGHAHGHESECGHAHEHSFEHDHEHAHDHGHAHEHGREHGHAHAAARDIAALIDGLPVSPAVRAHAKAVYAVIADAGSRVHGAPVDQIHFHEVGTMDAVADVVGVCLLMERIGAEQVIASPVHVGCGHVRCMHGVLPVPAPATALILTGIPTYGGAVEGELCTPTGAALLRHFCSRFGDSPVMRCEAVGTGIGRKDFGRANCVRAFLGESEGEQEEIAKLECNLDDMTGEDVGFAMERLFESGARDVYTVPCGMKKNRPGILLCCICMREDADRLAAVMMKYTTTLGVRRIGCARYVLSREREERETAYGRVRLKRAKGMGAEKLKAEYEDLAELARRTGRTPDEIRRAALSGEGESAS